MAYTNLQTPQTPTTVSPAPTASGGSLGNGSAFLSGDIAFVRGSFKFNAEDTSAAIPVNLNRIVPGTLRVVIIGTTSPSYVPNFRISQELDNSGVTTPAPAGTPQDGLMTINGLLTITRSVTGDSGLQVAFEVGGTQ